MTVSKIGKASSFTKVILVNEKDHRMGGDATKKEVHQKGWLHRAFSVFILRKRAEYELLFQKRHPQKYHSGGLWSNTCCSHPQPERSLSAEAQKCLMFEVGIHADLFCAGSVYYRTQFDSGLIEHEIDHVFYGFFDQDVTHIPFNRQEATDMRW